MKTVSKMRTIILWEQNNFSLNNSNSISIKLFGIAWHDYNW